MKFKVSIMRSKRGVLTMKWEELGEVEAKSMEMARNIVYNQLVDGKKVLGSLYETFRPSKGNARYEYADGMLFVSKLG